VIDGFKIVTVESVTISETHLIVTGEVTILQKIRNILILLANCDGVLQNPVRIGKLYFLN